VCACVRDCKCARVRVCVCVYACCVSASVSVSVSVSVFVPVSLSVCVSLQKYDGRVLLSEVRGILHYMGWIRLVGSLKFKVSFAEYSLFYRALVQKRSIILRSLLIVATP